MKKCYLTFVIHRDIYTHSNIFLSDKVKTAEKSGDHEKLALFYKRKQYLYYTSDKNMVVIKITQNYCKSAWTDIEFNRFIHFGILIQQKIYLICIVHFDLFLFFKIFIFTLITQNV